MACWPLGLLMIHIQSNPTNRSLNFETLPTPTSSEAIFAISNAVKSDIVSSENPSRSLLASPSQTHADCAKDSNSPSARELPIALMGRTLLICSDSRPKLLLYSPLFNLHS